MATKKPTHRKEFGTADDNSSPGTKDAEGTAIVAGAGAGNPDTALEKSEKASPETSLESAPVALENTAIIRRSPRLKRFVASVLLLVPLAFGGTLGYDWLIRGQFFITTNDAYVRSELTIISPKVAGYAVTVAVLENAHVKAGDLLVVIDPGDYQIAVEAAQGKIKTQNASIARIARQIDAQKAVVSRTKADLTAAGAEASRTAADLERTQSLAKRSFSSRKTLDAAHAALARANAAVQSAEAAVQAARANVEVFRAQQQEAIHLRQEYKTALKKTERDLEYTNVRAPIDGIVGNLAVKQGQLLQSGTRLLALVPLDRIYVEANFKETQISRLKVGQPVAIEVDAFREETISGRIESIAPAAGREFSLLPPENATGNFTKIVQRVPVRISIPSDVAAQGRLRPGLSVVVNVDTLDKSAPPPTLMGLLGWERAEAEGTREK